MVDRQSQYIQGYRVLYRPSGGAWLVQDVKAAHERSAVLTDLRKGTEYEIKIRPYFNELQGLDSLLLLARTPEEVPSAPPQAVTVMTVQLGNISSVSVSWEPPPVEAQNGLIQEYRIWCVGNDTQLLNQTADGSASSATLSGLQPSVLYQVEVAAVTSAGVGARSQPVTVFITPPAEPPPAPAAPEDSVSLAEQISGVVKQPAFIAGIGGACWVILMGFSVWIYCRRKKRKELSHYAASFAYTPAVGFSQGEGLGLINGRPGILGTNMGNYPWLADSWPTTNLVHGGKDSINCCTAKHNSTERYYNEVGISNYLSQTEKYSQGSTEGPIYSTIDPACEDMHPFAPPYSHPVPYASTPVLPYPSLAPDSPGPEGDHWTTHPGPSGVQYAQPDRARTENGKPLKQRSMGKAVKTPSLNWTEALPPQGEDHCYEEAGEEGDMGSDREEEWCPPLPERTYLMDGTLEELRGGCSSPAPSYSHQSTATLTPSPPAPSYSHQSSAALTPSPREEGRGPGGTPRPHHLDTAHLPRRGPCPHDPNLSSNSDAPEVSAPHHSSHRQDASQGAALSTENMTASGPGRSRPLPHDGPHTPQVHKSRAKKKGSKAGQYRRDQLAQGDLPPPPVPPPADERLLESVLHCGQASLDGEGTPLSSMERRGEQSAPYRRGQAPRHIEEEDIIPYCKPGFLSRCQMSSNCSTTGSVSSRGSTGSREHGAGRKRSEEMR
ncbi:hypothetical protein COCON_G00191700 [Conger conger]|uniref:Fibronectin type-III domain-containing protein n=1 Tax=Conger conger TaxID=82655 RepID=A0A9Q1D4G3_CONCO|nr:hypothetical protein COCON_G00191700 [Conger conger]